jgi:hypothetical protein
VRLVGERAAVLPWRRHSIAMTRLDEAARFEENKANRLKKRRW